MIRGNAHAVERADILSVLFNLNVWIETDSYKIKLSLLIETNQKK